jgi:hypothetical protein
VKRGTIPLSYQRGAYFVRIASNLIGYCIPVNRRCERRAKTAATLRGRAGRLRASVIQHSGKNYSDIPKRTAQVMAFLWRHPLIEQQEGRIKYRHPNVDPLWKLTAIEQACFQLIFG